MKYEYNRLNYITVQRLMKIKMVKAFCTTLSEALCILAGMIPIIIKTEEAVKQYIIRKGKGSQTHLFDSEVELKNWPHPADVVKIIEAKKYKEQTIQAYTNGRKNEHGVGSGMAIFVGKEPAAQLKFKLDNRCSTNQAEQLAIAKALEVIESIDISENSPRTVTIFTDSRIILDSLKNINNNGYLIEEIRKRVSILKRFNWTIEFSWVKAHIGIYGNELAIGLQKMLCETDTVRSLSTEFQRVHCTVK
jgi:ribonuclease HI